MIHDVGTQKYTRFETLHDYVYVLIFEFIDLFIFPKMSPFTRNFWYQSVRDGGQKSVICIMHFRSSWPVVFVQVTCWTKTHLTHENDMHFYKLKGHIISLAKMIKSLVTLKIDECSAAPRQQIRTNSPKRGNQYTPLNLNFVAGGHITSI